MAETDEEKDMAFIDAVEAKIAPECSNDPVNGCKQCQPYKED